SCTVTSAPRAVSAHAAAQPITPAPTTATRLMSLALPGIHRDVPIGDAVAQHADSLDLELDDVAGLQPAAVVLLEDGAAADGTRADHVARKQPAVACSLRHDRVPRVEEVAEISA